MIGEGILVIMRQRHDLGCRGNSICAHQFTLDSFVTLYAIPNSHSEIPSFYSVSKFFFFNFNLLSFSLTPYPVRGGDDNENVGCGSGHAGPI